MPKVIERTGDPELATVFVCEDEKGRMFEFVESIQPPRAREEKWVVIVSTMYGCPVKCTMCDAGGDYNGLISTEDMLWQVQEAIRTRFPDGLKTANLKVQFSRMGEPALNDNVLEALRMLPELEEVKAAGQVTASVSTIAPKGGDEFLEKLLAVKKDIYSNGNFQLQFSLHTTNMSQREKITKYPRWTWDQISDFGKRWKSNGDRKVTINFALIDGFEVDPDKVCELFDPESFIIKLTPLNPTVRSKEAGLDSRIDPDDLSQGESLAKELHERGFDTILSIGEFRENEIGSNCGYYMSKRSEASKLSE